MDYRGLTVKIGADDSQLSKVLGNLRTEARHIDDELKQVNRSLKFDSSDVDALARKQALYTEKIKNTEIQLEKLREGLRNAGAQNISTTQIERLRANIKECESALTSYSDEVEKLKNAQAFAKQEKQIRECSQAIALQESKIKTIDNLLQQLPRDSELLAAKQKAVTTALEQSRAKVQLLRDTYGNLTAQDLGKDEWERLQLEIKQAYAEVRQYATELSRVNTTKLNSVATSWQRVGASVRGVGSTLTGTLTPAIAVGAGAMVAAATTMDTALTGIRKTVDGTEEQYQALKDAAVEFSLTNAVSASTIMDIQALGAQLGYTIDELDMFGQVVSGLDIATNMDAETAATELAQFANITKMSHDETENYGAAIVGLGNSFATTEADISSMSMRLAAAGTQVGLSQADILGLATAMSSLGIEAEAGGSAMSTVMSKIDRAVANGGDSLELWADIAGVSAESFAQAWQNDPVQALQDVLVGINNASESGKNMNLVLDDLGINELRQIDAMKRMSQNAELVGKAVSKSNEEWEKNTALTNEVENRNNSLAAKFEMVKNRLVAIADRIGVPLANAFLEALDAAEPLFQAIENGADAFANMSKEEQQLVLGLVGIAAAAGPTLSAVGKIAEKSGGLIEKFGALDNKFTLLKGGAIGLAAALAGMLAVDVISQWKDYQDWCDLCTDATQSLDDAIASIDSTGVKDLAEGFDGVADGATKSADEINGAFRDTLKDIADTGKEFKKSFEDIEVDSQKIDQAVQTIDELRDKENLTTAEQERLRAAVESYNEITGASITIIDSQSGTLDTSSEAILRNADAWEALQKQQAYTNVIGDLNEDLIRLKMSAEDSAAELENIAKQHNQTSEELVAAVRSMFGDGLDWSMSISDVQHVQELADTYDEAQTQIANTESNLQTLNAEFEKNAEAVDAAKDSSLDDTQAKEDQATALDTVADSAEGATASMEGAVEIAYEYVDAQGRTISVSQEAADAFADMCTELGEFLSVNSLFAAALDDSGYSIPEFAAALQAADVDVSTFTQSVENLAGTTQNAFGLLEQQETISLDEMLTNLQQNQQAVSEWRDNLITLYQMAGDDVRASGFVEALAEMGPEYANQLQAIVDGGQEKFDELAQTWGDGANYAVSAAYESFNLGGSRILDGVNLTFSQLANAMQDLGLNIDDLGLLGANGFSTLAENLGVSASDMVAICDSLQIELDQSVRDAAQAAADASADMTGEPVANTEAMAADVSEAAEKIKDDLPTIYTDAAKQAAVDFAAAGVDITSASGDLVEDVKAATDPIKSAYPTIYREALTAASQEVTSGGEIAVAAAENTTTGIQSKFSALETSAPESAKVSMEGFNKAVDAAQGPARTAGGIVAKSALSPLTDLAGQASTAGTNAGSMYSSGLSAQSGPAQTAGTTVSNSGATGLQANNGNSYTWGLHLGGNFAAGLSDSSAQIAAAAQIAAEAAALPLRHSIPKKGVLANGGKGEKPWGEHLAKNFASGIKSSKSLDRIGKASNALAQTVVDYIGHSAPKKGALKGGEWVYGQHAAINFAEGLYSGRDAVKDAASSLAGSAAGALDEVDARIAQMAASYTRNVDEIKGSSHDLTVAINEMRTASEKTELATPAYAASAAYKDMAKIVEAGYKDVASFREASREFAEENVSWKEKIARNEEQYNSKMEAANTKYTDTVAKNKKKLDDLEEKGWKKKAELQEKFKKADEDYYEAERKLRENTDAKKVEQLTKNLKKANDNWYKAKYNLDHVWDDWYKLEAENKEADAKALATMNKTQKELTEDYRKSTMAMTGEYAAFVKEYDDYQKLAASLTTSLSDLEASESLYKVTSDIVDSVGSSNGLNAVLQELGTKGVAYTQEFVDAMVDGGDEYLEALGDMTSMTTEQLQSFVDSFETAEIAEREAALAARALYVEHGKQSTTTKSAQKIWLEYRETIMDVEEAMNGDVGLSRAFAHAGTTVEGLAADVMSLGVSMDDLVANAQGWGEKVSNGFTALSSAEKTGAGEYVRTLKNNMAETQQYTANVQKVFSQLTDTALEETEAFRKLVMEGGYDQFAGLMADMATMDSEQIMEIIGLYNDSIQQGMQDSIAQFQALAPGEEMMVATIAGMEAKRDEIAQSMQETAKAAAEAGVTLEPEFYSVGQQLAGGISSGILASAQSIAAAAAATVRQAIEAAKAAGDIHSPSRKMRDEVGVMLGRGVAVGVDDSNKYVRQSMDQLIGQPFVRESQAIDSRAYTTNATVNINMGAVTVRNDADIKKLAKEINREQARAMKGMGLS